MRVLLLCAAIAATCAYGAMAPCTCAFRNQTCDNCDSSKLFLVDTEAYWCTISCDKGWELTAFYPVNYVECYDGRFPNHQFIGASRDAYSRAELGQNPEISCVPATQRTCAAGAYQTFECADCDASKLFVADSGAECTLMCERNYRMVATGSFGTSIIHIGEATLMAGVWNMRKLWGMNLVVTSSDGTARFSCQWNDNVGPLPTTLPPTTLPPPTTAKTCPVCGMSGVPGTITQECLGDNSVVSCLTGNINVSRAGGSSVVFERASCMDDGTWFGTTCAGRVYHITDKDPFFNCPDVVLPPTTKMAPSAAPACLCPYEDAGAALKLDAPVSFCSNDKQMLKCDGKIYVKNGNTLSEFDSVSCTGGQWSGTGCSGSPSAVNTASVTVQCGAEAEPPLCPQLPSRGGLKYIGKEGGLQRYTCPGEELARITIEPGRTIHAKYFDCNSTYYQAGSSNDEFWAWYTNQIIDFSCRDYGSINKACSIPFATNAWLKDGVLRCVKGYYPTEISYIDASKARASVFSTAVDLSTATCGAQGWKIEGTTHSNVQLTKFRCAETPASAGTCGALSIASRNVQYNEKNALYQCWDTAAEEMKVITPSETYYGTKLQCVAGLWRFTGVTTVTIPAGSAVSCYPLKMEVLPPTSAPLIYAGKTPEGLSRWTCIDSTVTLNIEFEPNAGKFMPVHAAYIDCNNTHYNFASSISYELSNTASGKINTISCTDMGPKHAACTDPWDIGGIRRGNKYECLKGFFLNQLALIDSSNGFEWKYTDTTDTKSIECTRDGWQVQGTNLPGQRISAFWCHDVNPSVSKSDCSAGDIQFELYKIQFDLYRKQFTCYEGETLAYTLNNVKTYGAGRRLFCGKNSANAPQWQWSEMDGSQASPIPVGAKFTCI